VDRGIAGIIVAAADPGITGQPGRQGAGTVIERLRIVSADPPETEGTPTASSKEAPVAADPATVHGIWLQARAAIRDTCVEGFSGNGIHIEIGTGATETGTPEPGPGAWDVSGCWVAGCGGHGLAVLGAGNGVAHLLNVTDNGGWGIQDASATGSTFLQCVASGNGDGPFTATDRANRSLFVGCVAADDGTRAVFGAGTVVVGGTYAGGFAGGNTWTSDAARMTLQAQSPGDSDDRLPTVPTLHLRGAEGQMRAHLRISDRNTRLVEVDSAGRLLIGPADLAQAAAGGDGVGLQPVQVQISSPESGQAAVRWVVASEAGGGAGAWVAQARAYQDAGGTDQNPEGGAPRLTFQTPGPGTSEVDTLTLTGGRVGIGAVAPSPAAVLELASTGAGFLPPRLTSEQRDAIANPPEGLTIYNLTSHRLNVHDGEQWREVAFT
ncbi:MAG: right-handed parallel beta-helix repeat-containing protein, partial [Chloroflexota bacterium]|nr:right-handed parallel beta-helix repeat-containing protein [Chloroflexota bacterium]